MLRRGRAGIVVPGDRAPSVPRRDPRGVAARRLRRRRRCRAPRGAAARGRRPLLDGGTVDAGLSPSDAGPAPSDVGARRGAGRRRRDGPGVLLDEGPPRATAAARARPRPRDRRQSVRGAGPGRQCARPVHASRGGDGHRSLRRRARRSLGRRRRRVPRGGARHAPATSATGTPASAWSARCRVDRRRAPVAQSRHPGERFHCASRTTRRQRVSGRQAFCRISRSSASWSGRPRSKPRASIRRTAARAASRSCVVAAAMSARRSS